MLVENTNRSKNRKIVKNKRKHLTHGFDLRFQLHFSPAFRRIVVAIVTDVIVAS